MDTNKEQKGRYFQMPSALLVVLSDTALRILAYAIDKQGLVNLGHLEQWTLTPKDVSFMFGKFVGYSLNTVQKGFRELKELRLITYHQNNHYILNTAELETWYKKGGGQILGEGDGQNLAKEGGQNLATNKRDENKRDEREQSTKTKLGKSSIETSSASLQEPKALPPSNQFDSLFEQIFPSSVQAPQGSCPSVDSKAPSGNPHSRYGSHGENAPEEAPDAKKGHPESLPSSVALLAEGRLAQWKRDYPEGYSVLETNLVTRLGTVPNISGMEAYEFRAIADKVRSEYVVSQHQSKAVTV
jgi:hypothetical protein